MSIDELTSKMIRGVSYNVKQIGDNESCLPADIYMSIRLFIYAKYSFFLSFLLHHKRFSTNLAPEVNSHSHNGTDSCIHALRITSAGKDCNSMSFFASTTVNKLLNFISHFLFLFFCKKLHNNNKKKNYHNLITF